MTVAQTGWLDRGEIVLAPPALPAGAEEPTLALVVAPGLQAWRREWISGLRDYPHRCWELDCPECGLPQHVQLRHEDCPDCGAPLTNPEIPDYDPGQLALALPAGTPASTPPGGGTGRTEAAEVIVLLCPSCAADGRCDTG